MTEKGRFNLEMRQLENLKIIEGNIKMKKSENLSANRR